MKSKLFHSGKYRKVQTAVKNLINNSPDFLSENTAQSPRAAGDAIERIVARSFGDLLPEFCGEYSSSFERRAMADLAFEDSDKNNYIVDVKTHRTDTKFNMPNLTSVERIARFYENDHNFFTVLMVSYGVEGTKASVSDVKFFPIEFLDWKCLRIGALGWGQIQIANSNNITVNPENSRKKWMLEFCNAMLEFYPNEMKKIGERVSRFRKVKKDWEKKAE